MKIYLLFDCPNYSNDKQWLEKYLNKKYSNCVEVVTISKVLSELHKKGIKGKIYTYLILVRQSFSAIIHSKPGDVIVCWWRLSGLITNAISILFGNKRYIISLNWLSPLSTDKKIVKLIDKVFNNKKCKLTCNTFSSIKKWEEWIGYNLNNKFYIMPDVYDEKEEFTEPSIKKNKYCFTGGMNNRDWVFLNKLAAKMPDIIFVAVANKKDYLSSVERTQSNVHIYFDITPNDYYEKMKNASIFLLPLKDDKVAGLINILKSAQFGIPCIVNNTDSTKQYYIEHDLLLDKDVENWSNCIKYLLNDDEYYLEITKKFQTNIYRNFSPQNAVEKIESIISDLYKEERR